MAPATGTNYVIGTDRNDVLIFRGDLEHITTTLVNPYSGTTIDIDDIFRVNDAVYDGLAGNDVLSMSATGDFLALNDGNGNATLNSVERILAGSGGDVIILADHTLVVGDMMIAGGDGDDVIWANAGHDVIYAGAGNDVVDGGPGNDSIYGEAGDDRLWGGAGNDMLDGGSGNDILFGGTGNDTLYGGDGDDVLYGDDGPSSNPALYAHTVLSTHNFVGASYLYPYYNTPSNLVIPEENQGVREDNVAISYETTITATYIFSEAGYKNSLGFYRIGADGAIHDVSILMKNQHDHIYGTEFTYEYNGAAGDSLGMFIVADGVGMDASYRNADIMTGELLFIHDYNGPDQRPAMVGDDGNTVSLVHFVDGVETVFNVNIYHSALSGGVPSLNADGLVHAMSGLADGDDPSVLRIGFEDMNYLGDADFDDVVFDIRVDDRLDEIFGASDNDVLYGGAGNDTLYGGFGDDILIGGPGADHLYGGQGSDIFVFDTLDGYADTIYDFEYQQGGDSINVADVLSGYDPLTDALSDFLTLTQQGEDALLFVNPTGVSDGDFTHLATIIGGTGGLDLDALLAQGSLVADQSVVIP